MMNVFVIHSNADKAAVTEHITRIKRESFAFNPLVLENGNIFWKLDAAKKIKRSQMVIFIVGEKSRFFYKMLIFCEQSFIILPFLW